MSGTIPNQFKTSAMNNPSTTTTNQQEDTEEAPGYEHETKQPTTARRKLQLNDGEDDDGNDDEAQEEEDEESSCTGSLMSRSGNNSSQCVQVALRIRPLLPREVIANARECITVAESEPQVWIAGSHAFTYDHVFNKDVSQDNVFEVVAKGLVDGIVEGYNATILAYGQTGSGKTYTMGTGFDPTTSLNYEPTTGKSSTGLLPRCISYLFKKIANTKQSTTPPPDFTITIQFTELYNEEVIDLLARPTSSSQTTKSQIKIQEKSNGEILLLNITSKQVTSTADTLEVLKSGALNRTTASTNMNDSSSRSHAIFTITVTQNRVTRDKSSSAADIETLHGKFHFVDLAGSERLKRTLATGERAREGIAINSGLLALGNVISALGDKNKRSLHVPYRDSKLTRLLQDSLGGNSRTLMIACVSPNELDFVETLNTMKYANRAKNIKNKVVVNQDKSSRTISLLREEIARLTSELVEARKGGAGLEIGDVSAENVMLLAEVESLRSKVKSKQEMVDKLVSQVARLQAVAVTGGGSMDHQDRGEEETCDLTDMVTKYLAEIGDLRGRLYESESECEKLRAKQRVIIKNLSNNSPGGGRVDSEVSDLIRVVKQEIKAGRGSLGKGSSGERKVRGDEVTADQGGDNDQEDEEEDEEDNNSDGDSEEEDEETDTNAELGYITQEINTKERLIEELENSQFRIEALKTKYEEKLVALSNKIRVTEEERDALIKSRGGGKAVGKDDKGCNKAYESKISALQAELKKWESAKKEHAKIVKNLSSSEGKVAKLRGEVEEMKRVKVKLMNQVRNESVKFREMERVRLREISQLRKESRLKEVRVKKLESDGRVRDAVLKRKLQEVEMLKKNRGNGRVGGGRNGGVSRGSPVKGKQVWGKIHAAMVKDVSSRCSVSALEREMVGLIARRSELRGLLDSGVGDSEHISSINANLRMVEGRIESLQDEIVSVNEISEAQGGGGGVGKRESGNSSGVRGCWMMDGLVENDFNYVFEKLYEQSVGSLSEVSAMEGRVSEVEEVNRQLRTEVDTLRDLLHHMVYTTSSSNTESYSSNQGDSNNLLMKLMPPPPAVVASTAATQPNHQSNVKARRRLTSTTQELLGSCDSVVEGDHLNRTFTRNRLTQSLRGSSSSSRSKRVPLNRQDTYCVDNNNGGGGGGVMNTTFLVSNNEEASSSSSSSTTSNITTTVTNATATNPVIVNNHRVLIQRSVSEINRESLRSHGSYKSNSSSSSSTHTPNITPRPTTQQQNNNIFHLQGTLSGHTKSILCIASDESTLVSGSKDGSCRVWDLETRREVGCFEGHPHNVGAVCFVPESSLVLTGSSYQIKVFDLRCSRVVKVLGSSGTILPNSSNPQNQIIPILNTTIPRVNDLPTGEKTISFITKIRNYFFTSMGERTKIWDFRKLTNIGLLAGKHTAPVMCAAGYENGVRGNDYLVTGSKDHSIKVYQFGESEAPENINNCTKLTPVHYDGVECLWVGGGCGGEYLVSGSRDTCIKVWDLKSMKSVGSVTGAHGGWVTGVAGVPVRGGGSSELIDRVDLVATSSKDGVVKVWDVGGGSSEICEVGKFEVGGGGSGVVGSPVECIASNSTCLFFGSGFGISNNSYNNNNVASSDNNSSSSSSPVTIGIYKVSDHVVKQSTNGSSGVNTGSRGSGGSNPVSSTRTQYLD